MEPSFVRSESVIQKGASCFHPAASGAARHETSAMRPRFLFLLVLLTTCGAATLRPAAAPPAVRRMHIDPSATQVLVGEAQLSVDPLTRSGDGFNGTYRLEVSPIPVGSESGKFSVNLSDEQLRQLTGGQPVEFTGQAASTSGNHSE